MSDYDAMIQVRRAIASDDGGSGTQDPDTGVFVDTDEEDMDYEVVFEGPGDVQDMPVAVQRDQLGQPTLMADARVFMKDEKLVMKAKPGDTIVASFPDGSTDDGEIMRVQRLDGSLFLRRFRQ